MAFFTRNKSIPVSPDDVDLSDDDWEELEERRTPDGRSSKTSYELRISANQNQEHQIDQEKLEQVVECKNPCISESYEQAELKITEENDKTEDVGYEFVVDRVLGVQV